jgi:hypothetical protein
MLLSAISKCSFRLLIGVGIAVVGLLFATVLAMLLGSKGESAPFVVWWTCVYILAGWAFLPFVPIPYFGVPINLLLWVGLGLFVNAMAQDTGQYGHFFSYGLAAVVCVSLALAKTGAAPESPADGK